jgi:hypothetical protein
MKTNKHHTLLLVKAKQAVRAKDLVQAFGYSAPTRPLLPLPSPILSDRSCSNGSARVMC